MLDVSKKLASVERKIHFLNTATILSARLRQPMFVVGQLLLVNRGHGLTSARYRDVLGRINHHRLSALSPATLVKIQAACFPPQRTRLLLGSVFSKDGQLVLGHKATAFFPLSGEHVINGRYSVLE